VITKLQNCNIRKQRSNKRKHSLLIFTFIGKATLLALGRQYYDMHYLVDKEGTVELCKQRETIREIA
jgi:hypothetical protein